MNWIKCSERMPADKQLVLVWAADIFGGGHVVTTAQWFERTAYPWGSSDEFIDFSTITHWMPLPEPPHD
jgi:hypothetical protein